MDKMKQIREVRFKKENLINKAEVIMKYGLIGGFLYFFATSASLKYLIQ